MVERLKHVMKQLGAILKEMSSSRHLTIGVGAVLTFLVVASLVLIATSPKHEVLANVSNLEPEERRAVEQMLEEEGVNWEIKGDALMVEAGTRSRLFMKLNLEDKMPRNRMAFQWLFEETPFHTGTPKTVTEKSRLSQATELESVINSLHWVGSSKVVITRGNELDPEENRRFPSRATINIHSSSNRNLDNVDVKAVQLLVEFAVPKIKRKNVGIIVNGKPHMIEKKKEVIEETGQ